MKAIFRNASVYENGEFKKQTMLFDGASISSFHGDVSSMDNYSVFDNTVILPGFCDVHVHFREPGFSYKETIKSGSLSAARGGYTAVMTMPNLMPAPDTRENLNKQLEIIKRDALIPVFPYGTITKLQAGLELSDMEDMSADVIGYSDDGKGVQDTEMMRAAMIKAKELGKIIAAHCEDNSLLLGGYIHDGEYAKRNGHRGICSESEFGPIKRDLELVKETKCPYHVCHVSAKESIEAIREAKKNGIDVTCETGPHYLTMDDADLLDEGRFKMNPPIRAKEDREALVAGILDGTVDMIATDHAPHSQEEKSKGLAGSLMGVVGLETAFPVLYTDLVETGILPLELLVKLMSENPRKRFNVKTDPGFCVFEVGKDYTVDPSEFKTMGRATPFENKTVRARCILTVYDGRAVYEADN